MASTIVGAETGFEPIPGYVLRDKIGAGGYGEVWLADAPGGLKKAIKFVFGSVNEERAGSELKSLQRIRAVNHPFILSLERIEIIDSRLMVVTELADGSLLDRFREFHERGLVGIPRERLLEYMRDTADALDFLCQRHDLQHLDVKPANLLLVADRIKVADFGLIKDVQRNSMSLMGGMTPTYAAPEMFDGRPGRYSDQYSLAIVYQEMLTGSLPFRGRTTAQLATEHLHKAPNLEDLPVSERPVIARALAKKPSQRFGSCREMINALIAVHELPAAQRPVDRRTRDRRQGTSRHVNQIPVNDKHSPSRANANSRSSPEANSTKSWDDANSDIPSTEHREVVSLPPLDLKQDSIEPMSPALFIGFGGTGSEILTSLRSRLQASGMDLKEQSDVGWLLVDTDEKTVQRSTDAGTNGRLQYEQILLIPLKSSQQYRDRPQEPFVPLSRRWLFNVPRSQTTEGVRPLAMLAYLDHASLCCKVLEQLLENLAIQNQNLDRPETPKPPIRIYLVGSVHGATGSVLSIEFAFLLQQLLIGLDIHGSIQLVLTAGAESSMIAYELATAAGIACVNELTHYSKSAGLYPGIPMLMDFEPSKTPWENVYFVQGGKLGETSEWYSAIEQINNFLCMDACTALGRILDEERAKTISKAKQSEHCEWTEWARTIRSEKVDLGSKLVPEPFVKYVSLQALQPWLVKLTKLQRDSRGLENIGMSSRIDYFVNDLFRENRWSAQSWVRSVTDALMSHDLKSLSQSESVETAGDSDKSLMSILDLEEALPLESSDLGHIIEQLGLSIEASQRQALDLLTSTANNLLNAISKSWLTSREGWLSLSDLLDEIRQRLKKQIVSLQSVAQRFRDSADSLRSNNSLENDSSKRDKTTPNSLDTANQIRSLEFQAAVHSFASQVLMRLSNHVQVLFNLWNTQSKGLLDQFKLWSHTLANDLEICVDADGLVRDDRTPLTGSYGGAQNAVQQEINRHLLDLVKARFLQGIRDPVSSATSDVSEYAFDSTKTVNRFVDNDSLSRWIELSIDFLTATSKDIGIEITNASDDASGTTGDGQFDNLRNRLQTQELSLLGDGGAKRSILMIPKGTANVGELSNWQANQGSSLTIVEMEGLKSAQLYTEGEQMFLDQAFGRLWVRSRERCQLAERLHSRNDVDWLPIG